MENKRLLLPVDALKKGAVQSTSVDILNMPLNDSAVDDLKSNTINDAFLNEHISTEIINQQSKEQRQGMRLNHYNLMVRFEDGNQISEVPAIYPLPNSPSWFLGISNINGQTIPVLNLKKFLNVDEKRKTVGKVKKPMLFVVQQGENATGIVIDNLLERMVLDESRKQQNISLPEKLKECVNDTYLLNGELWYDLNCLSFLDTIEKEIAV